MLEKKDHVKRIQEITFEAYKSSGRIAALLDQNTGPSEQLSEELERVAAQIEHGGDRTPQPLRPLSGAASSGRAKARAGAVEHRRPCGV